MPLWQIYHPPGVFEDADSKAAIAADITKIYTSVGGVTKAETSKPFIRIVIKHIAIRLENNTERYRRTAGMIDAALKPHIYDKDYDCEFHVEETERRLWKFNGLIPPEHMSEEHMVWVKENRPVPYQGAYWSAEKGHY
ncbi:hypothetical protein QM012_000957 [Aureobasidium pullulans]|uniref:Tautomerase cis-CaaD-like domain-containing protein n=1 Tax=Aureobasidium pullulans TaxID=5580 RepID=A0ABR0TG67_AURPU